MFVELGLSITCDLSSQREAVWYITRESGQPPPLCPGMQGLVKGFGVSLDVRARRSVFAVKISGLGDKLEVLVVALAPSTIDWFEEHILPSIQHHVREGSWAAVVHISEFLVCKPPCLRGCSGACVCPEALLWKQGGWRRVPVPELQVRNLPFWWTGVSDSIGEVYADGTPWLRCVCGAR